MRETGCVSDINGSHALIKMDFKGGCAGCSMNGVCKTDGSGKRELDLPVGALQLKPGDLVEIETAPRSLLTAAFLIFILPLLLSFGAYFLMFHLTESRGYGLAGFFICFALSLLIVSVVDKTAGKGKFFEPQIVKKV